MREALGMLHTYVCPGECAGFWVEKSPRSLELERAERARELERPDYSEGL